MFGAILRLIARRSLPAPACRRAGKWRSAMQRGRPAVRHCIACQQLIRPSCQGYGSRALGYTQDTTTRNSPFNGLQSLYIRSTRLLSQLPLCAVDSRVIFLRLLWSKNSIVRSFTRHADGHPAALQSVGNGQPANARTHGKVIATAAVSLSQ